MGQKVSVEGAEFGDVNYMTDREPGPSISVARSEGVPTLPGSEPSRLWEARCRDADGDKYRWPAPESLALLEALRQFIVVGEEARLRRASQIWALANPSVAVLLRRLSCLRELFDDEGISRVPELNDRFRRALDAVTAIATETATSALADAALTDSLTGAGNRRALQESARVVFEQASRSAEVVSVAVIDLKGLKEINDTQGHAAGDKALAGFTASLRAAMRETDRLFRVGGDEFVLLLPGATEDAVAKVMGRAVRFNAPDFSWGAATFPLEGSDLDSLLELADSRLYESRHEEGYYGYRTAQDLARWAPAGSLGLAAADSPAGRRERRRRKLVPVALGGMAALGAVLLSMSVKPAPSRTMPPRYSPEVSLTLAPSQSVPSAGVVPASGGMPAAPAGRSAPSSSPAATNPVSSATTAPPAPPSTAPSAALMPSPVTTPPSTSVSAAPPGPQNGGRPPGNGPGNGDGHSSNGGPSTKGSKSAQSTVTSGSTGGSSSSGQGNKK